MVDELLRQIVVVLQPIFVWRIHTMLTIFTYGFGYNILEEAQLCLLKTEVTVFMDKLEFEVYLLLLGI